MRASDLVIVAAFGLAMLIACGDKSPTAPSAPRTPSTPSTTRLEIVGPASMAPGATAQFSVTQHLSDGSRRDATTGAQWSSNFQDVLSINSTGLATAHKIGDSLLTVTIVGLGSGTREIMVVPDGTYRLAGVVSEADDPRVAVMDARVDAVSGGRIVDTMTTEPNGRYRLYGVAGPTEVRVTKAGYTPLVETVTVVDHQTQNFLMALEKPRPNVAGTYTLTITASPSCRSQLPEWAGQRMYGAALTQQGPQVDVTLSGAVFVVSRYSQGNHFRGRIEAQEMTLSLARYEGYYYYYSDAYGDVVEYVDNTFYLVINGVTVLGISGRQFSGRLDGSFEVYPAGPRYTTQRTAECKAPDHQFVLAAR